MAHPYATPGIVPPALRDWLSKCVGVDIEVSFMPPRGRQADPLCTISKATIADTKDPAEVFAALGFDDGGAPRFGFYTLTCSRQKKDYTWQVKEESEQPNDNTSTPVATPGVCLNCQLFRNMLSDQHARHMLALDKLNNSGDVNIRMMERHGDVMEVLVKRGASLVELQDALTDENTPDSERSRIVSQLETLVTNISSKLLGDKEAKQSTEGNGLSLRKRIITALTDERAREVCREDDDLAALYLAGTEEAATAAIDALKDKLNSLTHLFTSTEVLKLHSLFR